MKRIAMAILVAVVLAGWGEPLNQRGPWDVEPRQLGWWRALCTLLRIRRILRSSH
jgi:hypothetical protein